MQKILIIEDDASVLENIEELLFSENYIVYKASNGLDGVDKAQKHLPDLIISDIMMPKMDGYQVKSELNKHNSTQNIPFIFLTARSEHTDLRYGMKLGADDYLTKPFTPQELFDAINTRLSKKKKLLEESENKLNTLRLNLASSLPHELRTPLNGILGSAQFLNEYFESLDTDDIKQIHSTIYSSAKRLQRLVVNYLFYADIELTLTSSEQTNKYRGHFTESAKDIIESTIQTKASLYNRSDDINFDIIDAKLQIEEHHFTKMIDELSDNAVKFSNVGTKINVRTQISNNYYQIILKDNGRGMSPDEISNIGAYSQFSRNIYEQQGSGLGLIIAKKIAILYNGDIAIESDNSSFTKITAVLPIAK